MQKMNLVLKPKMIKLRDLHFKHCEGYYSKNANACIFPCSISEMDKDDPDDRDLSKGYPVG